jgi:succinate dehydrogenase / fumarate reductase, cytochrome b subunit
MAITGVIWVGYLVLHLVGNLLVFTGPEKINGYAFQLHDMAALLWAVRIVLIVAFVLHVLSGIRLAALNRMARPEGYAAKAHDRSTLASRSMILSGLLVLGFLVYHLLHFTVGLTHPQHFGMQDPLGHRDVFSMILLGFQEPAVAAMYVVAMVLVGMHLRHGIASIFQSVGLTSPKYSPLINRAGVLLAAVLIAGFIAIPVAIVAGFIKGA